MERLTKRFAGIEEASLSCERCGKNAIYECWSQENCTQTAVDRLAQIEDILGDTYDLDRLRELVEADKDGRCVVLQKEPALKKGDRVWYVDRENGEMESGTVFLAAYKDGKLDSFSVDFDCGDFDEFSGGALGRCFFESKEAAEAALAKEANHE